LCLDVEGFPLENHWYFAYPQGKQLSPVARAFLDFARMEAKKLVLGSCAAASAVRAA
jgi:DNA-binding transcriptional LysR family regulator